MIGPSVFDIFPKLDKKWFDLLTDIALTMVGFLLGGNLSKSVYKKHGKHVFYISIFVVIITTLLVTSGLLLFKTPISVALFLGGISAATAPAATADVVKELKAKGNFTKTLLGIVAIDDAWGLIVFSMILAVVHSVNGEGGIQSTLLKSLWEIGGAVLIGVLLGIPMAYLSGRIKPGEPTLTEALGIVFICSGLAIYFDFSFLIASMVLGATVRNLAKHHTRSFHAIEGIEWPFMLLFFILAGVSLNISSLLQIGMLVPLYVIFRIIGRIAGGWVGARLGHAPPIFSGYIGLALMPQAGVAIGMALIVVYQFPDMADIILPVVIGATIIFEIFGPIMTRLALSKAGEIKT